MGGLPDPDWYLDHVLVHAEPGVHRSVQPGPAAQWRAWWDAAAARVARERPAMYAVAATQGPALTTAQLAALGVTRHRVRRAVLASQWVAPRRGVVSLIGATQLGADAPTQRARERRAHVAPSVAVALLNPGHVVSGRSAAILHGLPTRELPNAPEVTAPAARASTRLGARTGVTPGEQRARWFGIEVHSAARTVVDLARRDRGDGLMAADAALREALVTPAALARALDVARLWPGVRQAREIVALASALAESPLESLVRLALHDSGFPPPRLQVEIAAPGQHRPYRVDMLWPGARLILEVDGREKYTGDALWREKRRETRLRRLGYRVERAVWSDLAPAAWTELCGALREALSGA